MGHVVILGVFVADTAYRAERMPIIGETVLGNSFTAQSKWSRFNMRNKRETRF